MIEAEQSRIAGASPSMADEEALTGIEVRIAALQDRGADKFDPVRFHYIESLSRRAAAQDDGVRRMLGERLAHALSALQDQFDSALADAKQAVAQGGQQYPGAADELRTLLDTGNFAGLRRRLAALKTGAQNASLRDLVNSLGHAGASSADGGTGSLSCPTFSKDASRATSQVSSKPAFQATSQTSPGDVAAPYPELKAIRNFRDTWSRLSVERQVSQALQQAPRNAGPINSHMLVLRSLELMREVSPEYLNRFMSYADTLLALDQDDKDKPAAPKKKRAVKAKK